ncbi:MAG: hypothetical protein MSH60_05050 [Ruminococcus sp.]|nr:hypothetical protein [Ruminococcus sp.]
MKMSKILAAAAAGAMAVSMMAAMPASAEGTYHAYLGIQSASFTFRNAWYEPNYGQGVAAEDGTNYFDHLTGWDGPTATNNGGTFTDAEITGDGTYSVSLTGDFNFGSDEALNLLFVSTDIPLDAGITISDVKVKIDGSTKYTFDEAYLSPDAAEYLEPMAINIWNDDLGKADGLFGYTMPTSSVEVEFTVSGMAAAPAEETTEAAPEETAAPAETEAAPADTTETTAPATGNASAAAIVAVMAVAGTAAVISKKRK